MIAAGTSATVLRGQNPFWEKDATFAPVLQSPQISFEQTFTSIARQPDGKLLALGYVERVNGNQRVNPSAPLRFNTNGTLDSSFNATENANSLALFRQPSGKVVLSSGVRLNVDGTRDPGFQFASNFRTVLAADGLGRLYVQRHDGVLIRTTIDGTDDGQFRSSEAPFSENAIAAFDDGSVAIARAVDVQVYGYTYREFSVTRLRADGSVDSGFARYVDRIQENNFLGLVALPDGRVLLYGTTYAENGVSIRFVRLGSDGKPDYIYVSPGSASSAPRLEEALTLAGVLYDLSKQGAWIAPVRTAFTTGVSRASLDLASDGTLWLATTFWPTPGTLERYRRSTTRSLTIDPRPTLLVQSAFPPLHRIIGEAARISAPAAGGLSPIAYQWFKDGVPIPGATAETLNIVPRTGSDSGNYTVRLSNTHGTVTSKPFTLTVDTTPAPIVLKESLEDRTVAVGSSLHWSVRGTANPFPSFAWTRAGHPISAVSGSAGREATSSVLIPSVQPEHAGIYESTVTSGTSSKLLRAVLGVLSDEKTAGAATQVGANILHPNGNTFDQVLLSGAAAAITADPGQITRMSFVDLTGDIVQVELSGAGTLAVVLENAGAPAPAANYNQPSVQYVRGHAGIVIAGADATTNVSVFSVGRANAVNQSLFRDNVDYDGMADVSFIAISSKDGRFGGLRTANVQYYAHRGFAGVYAPGVAFAGPVFVGDIDAFDHATPVLALRSAQELRVAGGDLRQTNRKAVLVGELTPRTFTAGVTSHGDTLPRQTNRATFKRLTTQ